VNIGKTIGYLSLAGILFITFFEVKFVPQFSLPTETRVPDPTVEADYQRCYQAQDAEIHKKAFDTIDNPDVQKLYITTNRARARAECRKLYPESMITVEQSLRFNLFDLTSRFW